MKVSLFKKIGISFLLATIIPVAVAFVFIEKTATEIIIQQNYQYNMGSAWQITNQVELFISHTENIVKSIAQLEVFKEGDREGMGKVLEKYAQDFTVRGEKLFETFIVVDKDGRVAASYPYREEYIGLNYSHYGYYQEIINGKEKYISSNVFVSPVTDKPMIEIAFPAIDEQGDVSFIISANISLDSVAKIFQQIKIGGGYVSITDKKGVFLAHPDEKLVFQRQNINNIFPGLFKKIKEGKKDIFWPEKDPQFIFTWAALPFGDWGVIFIQEIEDAFLLPEIIRQLFISLFFATFLIVVLISFLISRKITEPIQAIQEAARKVAGGNLDAEAKIKTGDEIEELGNHINFTIKKISGYQRELEKVKTALEITVNERTKELKDALENREAVIKERTIALREKLEELERFRKFAVDRELKMIELKQIIREKEEKIKKIKDNV